MNTLIDFFLKLSHEFNGLLYIYESVLQLKTYKSKGRVKSSADSFILTERSKTIWTTILFVDLLS